ncbi:MAG TPA: hypothetical protein VF914_21665 [Chloroflexia bacterium]|jgi:hypothetical protein
MDRKSKEQLIYRQGDVALVRLPEGSVPTGAQSVRENGRIILAHGEVTGHAHEVVGGEAELWEAAGLRYLTVERISELTHQEHGTITVHPGVYEVRRQREYSPEEIRQVAD